MKEGGLVLALTCPPKFHSRSQSDRCAGTTSPINGDPASQLTGLKASAGCQAPQDTLGGLVESMSCRDRAVLAAQGVPTQYHNIRQVGLMLWPISADHRTVDKCKKYRDEDLYS